ncbi:hypothetical protein LV75_006500 [Actinokineospora diospyrosa]|uniref:AbiV family abortive infection protein n=2 Tax=Actinokineospora diospyrosa TaxID=103728 RepID=A0ABT1IMT1_9PSEU|nr:hypothetical protein [Actinokineospora diospyrosa]
MDELDAADSLLKRSLDLLGRFRSAAHDADPLLACLSIGVEKTTKLTLGMAGVQDSGRWPDKATMKGSWGHQVVLLDRKCREYMTSHADRSTVTPLIRRLLDEVARDHVLAAVLETLDRYGTEGRFHNLDALAESPQAKPSPRDLWTRTDLLVWESDPALLATVGGPGFAQARTQVNGIISASITRWRELYFRAWITGVLGTDARQWSAYLDPTA